VGSTATLAVAAVGILPLSYQWQTNGVNLIDGGGIGGSTNNVLTITDVQTNNSGTYTVIVTNIAGSVTSSNAILTVASPPVIEIQPTNQAMAVGSTAIFAVTAVGTEPLNYQWQMNGTNLVDGTDPVNGDITSGSTTNVLTISNAQTNNSGTYTVIVTNIAGISDQFQCHPDGGIAAGDRNTTNQPGDGGGFDCDLRCHRSRDGAVELPVADETGTNLVDGTDPVNGDITSGSTTNVLTISNAQTTNSGSYTVIIANSAGSVTSSNAVLTVTNMPPTVTVQTDEPDSGGGDDCDVQRIRDRNVAFFFQWQKRRGETWWMGQPSVFNHQWLNQFHLDHHRRAD